MCTASARCVDAHERPISTAAPGLISVQALCDSVREAAKRQTKKSQSAGFFTYVAAQNATQLLQLAAGGFQPDVSALRNVVHASAAEDCGGFRDVGNHTTAKPLPTCWPLVQHAFHFFAQQVPVCLHHGPRVRPDTSPRLPACTCTCTCT